nr:MAG TPA: hypothetical protein [Caudoviricetes sp.]
MLAITSQYIRKRGILYFFHSNQRKRDWSWMQPNPVNKKLESRSLFYFVH